MTKIFVIILVVAFAFVADGQKNILVQQKGALEAYGYITPYRPRCYYYNDKRTFDKVEVDKLPDDFIRVQSVPKDFRVADSKLSIKPNYPYSVPYYPCGCNPYYIPYYCRQYYYLFNYYFYYPYYYKNYWYYPCYLSQTQMFYARIEIAVDKSDNIRAVVAVDTSIAEADKDVE